MPAHRSVLIVDDEYTLRKSLSILLSKAGYKVTSANSLEQARVELAKGKFNLVLLDLKLPDGMGSELLPLLRQQKPVPHVMILSATPFHALEFDPCSQGVDIYLEKPCEPEDILQAAHQLIGG